MGWRVPFHSCGLWHSIRSKLFSISSHSSTPICSEVCIIIIIRLHINGLLETTTADPQPRALRAQKRLLHIPDDINRQSLATQGVNETDMVLDQTAMT